MVEVVVLDNDVRAARELAQAVERMGYPASVAQGMDQATEKLEAIDCAIVYLDAAVNNGLLLEALDLLRAQPCAPEVIVLSPIADPSYAESVIRQGAWDCVDKSAGPERLLLPLVRAVQQIEKRASRGTPLIFNRENIIGNSPRIHDCLDQMARAAATDADVLINGETGTGKELFASAIHDNSTRADDAFVVVDCTSLPATLAESILFGHVKGAFTSADAPQRGLVEQAHGGTLFLDEVGELPLDIQAKFLRVLQERRFRPVGSTREKVSDFRLLAATHRNLEEMVELREFRSDLFYRLKTFNLTLPPLRKRKEDIKDLVYFYLAKTGGRNQGGIKGVSPEFIRMLWRYDWPGNVRELFHTLENSLVSAHEEDTLQPRHLPMDLRLKITSQAMDESAFSGEDSAPDDAGKVLSKVVAPTGPQLSDEGPLPPWKAFRERSIGEAEKSYFSSLVALCHGDIALACDMAGVKQARLYQIMKKHGITRNG